MKISVQMAAISHLSDAQELLGLCNPRQLTERVSKEINFVKQLLLEHPDTSEEVTEEELNRIYYSATNHETN